MFAAREGFAATDFGKTVMENVGAIAGEIMEIGTGYVNAEGKIRDLQKSSEIVGGLVMAGSLALGLVHSRRSLQG